MKTLVRTYEGDIYIIDGKSPIELLASVKDQDFIQMPNGSVITRKSISAFQTYEDYQFQTEQKSRHKKGQFIRGGNWNDEQGAVANAELEKITSNVIKRIY